MEISFHRMPSSSRVLILSAIFSLSKALPWSGPDPTAPYRPADWNPRTTSVPQSTPELIKRDNPNASICGWVGGNVYQPAACPSNEMCVYDTIHGMVGCCPLSGSCTVGVYTNCVHSAQKSLNPSVLTCTGGSVCFENSYPGGYFQYACGASTDGQSVATTYSGQNYNFQLPVVYTQLSLATSLSASTTSSSSSSTSSTSPSSTISLTSFSTTGTVTASTASPSNTSSTDLPVGPQAASTTAAAVSATGQSSQTQVGIIAGSVVGGIAVIFAALSIGCVLMRRRQRKKTEERERSIITKEKSLSVSSYASSQMSDRAGFHPFSPDDIVSPTHGLPSYDIVVPTHDISLRAHDISLPTHDIPLPTHDIPLPTHDIVSPAQDVISPHDIPSPTHDIVSPMTPFLQPTVVSLQSTLSVDAQHDIFHQPLPQHASPQYASPQQATPQQATPQQSTPRQSTPRQATPLQKIPQQVTPQKEVPHQELQQLVEHEAPQLRRVQLFDGPSIDELADLPPPWVRPPTPPARSPKRPSVLKAQDKAPQIPPPVEHTPLEIYLNSQILPLHQSPSVSSYSSDSSRYSRTTDGRSIHAAESRSNGWREEEVPPMPKMPKMPIVRKPVGTGWYRAVGPSVEKKKPGDHVAFHLVDNPLRPNTGRSLTPPQQLCEQERSFSAPPPASMTGDMLGLYAEICVNTYDGRGFEEMDSASDRVAPLKLSASHGPNDVKKRKDTQVPILGVPAAPPPGGRGSRLYEV